MDKVFTGIITNTNVQSFIISIAAGITLDKIEKERKNNTSDAQTYMLLRDTFEKFYNTYDLEYEEKCVMSSFKEACCETKCEKLNYSSCLQEVLEKTIGLEIGDSEVEKWIRIFCDICSKPKYEEIYKKISLEMNMKSELIYVKDKKQIIINILASLRNYINETQDDFMGENLSWYNDVVAALNNKMQISWKDNLVTELCKAKNIDDKFQEKINYIKENHLCDKVLEIANDLLEHYEWEKKNEHILWDLINKCNFNKVFIVTGSEGAGKTYFIRKYIRYAIKLLENKEQCIIPVIISKLESEKIGDAFLKACEEILETHIDSDIDKCVEVLDTYKFKICFIIDDLQNACIKNYKLVDEIIQQIERFSKYEVFRWIITVDEYDYYLFVDKIKFIQKYSIRKDSLQITNIVQDFVFNVGLNLTEFNKYNNVCELILNDIYNAYYVNYKANLYETDLSYGVTTPLLTHLLGECVQGEEILKLPNTYIDYVKKICTWGNYKLEKVFHDSVFYKDLNNILNICYDSKKIDIPRNTLLKIVNEDIVQELHINRFLRYVQQVNENIFSVELKIESYRLQNIIFWATKLVQFINDKKRLSAKELQKFSKDFLDWLIPSYILFVSETNKQYSKLINDLFENDLGVNVVFCFSKIDVEYSKQLFEYLKSNLHTINNTKICYATLYFICFSQISIRDKFILCKLLASRIVEYQLEDIYEMFFKAIVSRASSLKNFKKNMFVLVGCSHKRVNIINGYRCAEVYCNLLEKENKEFITSLKEIICDIYRREEVNKDIKNGTNSSFMDYFIRGCFEYQIKISPNIQEQYDKYKPIFDENTEICHCVRRNFTCAAGNYFSKHGKYTLYRKGYIELVRHLSSQRRDKDKKMALFLIVNSRQNENKVDKILLEELQKLFKKNSWLKGIYANEPDVKFWLNK